MDESQMNDDYVFCFVGGSSGSFAKAIFFYYFHYIKRKSKTKFFEIDNTGHCNFTTQTFTFAHGHYVDNLDLSKKLVLIDFDEDDKPLIVKMAFHKVVKKQIADDPNFLTTQWNNPLFESCRHDTKLLEQIFIDNPGYLIFEDWKDQIKNLNPVLTIKFKDIMFGNLNSIIANFFNVAPMPEVDKFIEQYRAINQQYITE